MSAGQQMLLGTGGNSLPPNVMIAGTNVGGNFVGFQISGTPSDWGQWGGAEVNGQEVLGVHDYTTDANNFGFAFRTKANGLPQNFFNTVTVVGPGVNVTLATADAFIFTNVQPTTWIWRPLIGVQLGGRYEVTWT